MKIKKMKVSKRKVRQKIFEGIRLTGWECYDPRSKAKLSYIFEDLFSYLESKGIELGV